MKNILKLFICLIILSGCKIEKQNTLNSDLEAAETDNFDKNTESEEDKKDGGESSGGETGGVDKKSSYVIEISMFDQARLDDGWDDLYLKVRIDVSGHSPEAEIDVYENDYEFYYSFEYGAKPPATRKIAVIEIEEPLKYLGGVITVEVHYGGSDVWRPFGAGEYPDGVIQSRVPFVGYVHENNYKEFPCRENRLIIPSDKQKSAYCLLKYTARFY